MIWQCTLAQLPLMSSPHVKTGRYSIKLWPQHVPRHFFFQNFQFHDHSSKVKGHRSKMKCAFTTSSSSHNILMHSTDGTAALWEIVSIYRTVNFWKYAVNLESHGHKAIKNMPFLQACIRTWQFNDINEGFWPSVQYRKQGKMLLI